MVGRDRVILNSGDPNQIRSRILAIFQNRSVDPGMHLGGTRVAAGPRIERLVHQVLDGQVSFQAIRKSVDRIAEAEHERSGEHADQHIMRSGDRNRVRERIKAIFENRGVDVALNFDGSLTDGNERLERLVDEVLAGSRSFASIRSSVDRIAQEHPFGPPPEQDSEEERRARDARDEQVRRRVAEQGAATLMETLGSFFSVGEAKQLAQMATNLIIEGANEAEIMQTLRDTDVYRERFPAMEARRQAGLQPISEAQYVALESEYERLLRDAGMPEGFFDDKDDFSDFIGKNLSPQRLSRRLEQGYTAAMNADPTVRNELSRLYGLDEGALASFFIDPDRAWSSIERKLQSAQVAGAAQRTSFGDLTRQQAERIQGLGVDEREAVQGFSQLGLTQELWRSLPGERGDSFSRDEQIAGQFAKDTHVQRRFMRQQDRRKAVFEGGGGSTANTSGLGGLQSSNI